jgi:hypothetical protein
MEQKTLKYLRVLIPGIIILLGAYPIFLHYFGEAYDFKGLGITYITFISILLGGVYYQLNVQRLLTSVSHYFIRRNILNKLIKAYGKTVNDAQREKLMFKDNYMTVFYKIIDNDESLKRKGLNVMFNGIFWTSTADSALISFAFYFIYKYGYRSIEKVDDLLSIFLFTGCISIVLHLISVLKHIRLSNEQLNPIMTDRELSKKVEDKFDVILN